MLFVLFCLLVNSLEDLADVGTPVRIYLRVVLLQQAMSSHLCILLGVCLQLFVDAVIVRLVASLPRNYVDNHVLQCVVFPRRLLPLRMKYLDENSRRCAIEICLHGSRQKFDTESHVENFRRVEFLKITHDSSGNQQNICISEMLLRPGSNCTTGMHAYVNCLFQKTCFGSISISPILKMFLSVGSIKI